MVVLVLKVRFSLSPPLLSLSPPLLSVKNLEHPLTLVTYTGGSTIGALANLIERNPYAFEGFGLEIGVDEKELEAATRAVAQGGANGHRESLPLVGVGRDGGGKSAAKVWDLIRCVFDSFSSFDVIARSENATGVSE
jgi:hypothetical protein